MNRKYFPQVSERSIRSKLDMITLETHRKINDIKFLLKAVNNKIDSSDIVNQIKYITPTHSTRQHNIFFTMQSNTNYYLNSPLHRICTSYNKLSQIMSVDIFCSNLDTFQNSLKRYFLSND